MKLYAPVAKYFIIYCDWPYAYGAHTGITSYQYRLDLLVQVGFISTGWNYQYRLDLSAQVGFIRTGWIY